MRRPAILLLWASAFFYGSAFAGVLDPVVEGMLGVPLGPTQFWEYREPTTLLVRRQFVVSVSGQAASLLARKYHTGARDEGYALGIGGGAVARWDYGTTGFWALGSGQWQRWRDPEGLYTLTPSPKIGFMAVSHAWQRGGWAIGGTAYRASFSMSDVFRFERFPHSDNAWINRYFYDLLPHAIGREIAYDIIGDRLSLFGDVRRETPVGQFGAVVNWWSAETNWLTQHENTMTDPRYGRHLLAGTKRGAGSGLWSGAGLEGRWEREFLGALRAKLRAGYDRWSGIVEMWLRNPRILISESGLVETRDWGQDTLWASSWGGGLEMTWRRAERMRITARLRWARHEVETYAFARTPVLDIAPGFRFVEQAAWVGLIGTFDAASIEVALSRRRGSSPWSWRVGAGMLQIDGSARTAFEPRTYGFRVDPSQHRWKWRALRLGHVEVEISRRLTSQISLRYFYRQYVPLSGKWERDGLPAQVPGEISGFRLGSLHQLGAAMTL